MGRHYSRNRHRSSSRRKTDSGDDFLMGCLTAFFLLPFLGVFKLLSSDEGERTTGLSMVLVFVVIVVIAVVVGAVVE